MSNHEHRSISSGQKLSLKLGRSRSSSNLKESSVFDKVIFFESQQCMTQETQNHQPQKLDPKRKGLPHNNESRHYCGDSSKRQHRTACRVESVPLANTCDLGNKQLQISSSDYTIESNYLTHCENMSSGIWSKNCNDRSDRSPHHSSRRIQCCFCSDRVGAPSSNILQIPKSKMGRLKASSQGESLKICEKSQNDIKATLIENRNLHSHDQLTQTPHLQYVIKRDRLTHVPFSNAEATVSITYDEDVTGNSTGQVNNIPFAEDSPILTKNDLMFSTSGSLLESSPSPSDCTDSPSEVSGISRSTSPACLSDAASKEDFDATICLLPHDCLSDPGNVGNRQRGSDNGSQKSTATINLTLGNATQQSKKAGSNQRKIHVIKTSSSLPDFLQIETPAPRLDEWLSSVMKIQEERPKDSQWSFPDYDIRSPTQDESYVAVTYSPINAHGYDKNDSLLTVKNCRKKVIATQTNLTIPPSKGGLEQFDSCHRCSSTSPECHQYSVFHSDQGQNQESELLLSLSQNEQRAKPSTDQSTSLHSQGGDVCSMTDGYLKAQKIYEYGQFQFPSSSPITICVTEARAPSKEKQSRECYSNQNCAQDLCECYQTLYPSDGRQRHSRYSSDRFPSFCASPHNNSVTASNIRPASENSRTPSSFRLPLSPRSSVGSVTSILSTRSSNADSAVDLCPPDDDQDLETETEDHTDISLEKKSYSSIVFKCHNINSDGSKHNSNTSSKGDLDVKERIHPNCQRPQCISSDATQKQSRDYTRVDNTRNENFFVFNETPPLPGPRKNCVTRFQTHISKSEAGDVVFLPSPTSSARGGQNIQSEHSIEVNCKTLSEVHPDSRDADNFNESSNLDRNAQQNIRGDNIILKSLPPSIPHLVISDHSDMSPSEPNEYIEQNDYSFRSSSPCDLTFGDVLPTTMSSPTHCANNRSYVSSPVSLESNSSSNMGIDFLDVKFRNSRSGSMSSISSEGSTCSTCTLYSGSETGSTAPQRKQSSWRKIRSFILWSPFIQVFKKHRYPWIQLAGHQGNFQAGDAGSVLKKLDSREQRCFQKLMSDSLRDFVPEYRGDVEKNGDTFIQLQDLLSSFTQPSVMDIKMGVRTYLEEELHKARKSPTLRKDMYQKMLDIDTSAPTAEEHEQKAVTKPRYMQWRDEMSSSVELGFRVEGIKNGEGNSSKDFKKTKSRKNVVEVIRSFVGDNQNIVTKYIRRIKDIMHTQESSPFFTSHEVVGSSLLFVHDAEENVSIWMIDFGKTEPLPESVTIDHRKQWVEGNHEDGYLFGLDNLLSVLEEIDAGFSSSSV